jgi:ubiquinone/menaquinone biosynthesis C-methylase UbiE
LEVIGDCDIHREVETLDVGCGRGGTIAVLNRYFQPRKTTGIDLSSSAIAFCKRHHHYPNAHFLEGDSEHLPFADASFDVVTNLESSHSYPDVTAFYREVSRVLRAGGYFLYTDLFAVNRLEQQLHHLQAQGLDLERRQDITPNVLLSCDEIGKTHFNAFAKDNDADFMGNFLGVPGSKLYNDMRDGQTTYQIFKFKKTRDSERLG